MADWVVFLFGAGIGIALGAQAISAWIEIRHDCMPHGPERCRDKN